MAVINSLGRRISSNNGRACNIYSGHGAMTECALMDVTHPPGKNLMKQKLMVFQGLQDLEVKQLCGLNIGFPNSQDLKNSRCNQNATEYENVLQACGGVAFEQSTVTTHRECGGLTLKDEGCRDNIINVIVWKSA